MLWCSIFLPALPLEVYARGSDDDTTQPFAVGSGGSRPQIVAANAAARTGGVKGTLGLAEDTADASVACRQVGEISFAEPLRRQEEVFSQSASILFKKIRIVRMVDSARNTLVYLVYSDKLIDGSPQNNVTAVPVPQAVAIPVR